MSIGEPFLLVPLTNVEFQMGWWSTGTSTGADWSILFNTKIPNGYAPIGDHVYSAFHTGSPYLARMDLNMGALTFAYVRKNRYDAAIPCSDYERIITTTKGIQSTVWRPIHTNKDYIGVGHVCREGTTKPPIGMYYVIHKAYLINAGSNAPLFLDRTFGQVFRTVATTNLFRYGDTQQYGVRDDNAIQACCTGSGSSCADLAPGSLSCQTSMSAYCQPNDIKPGGKCENWCARDPTNCDKLKNNFCDMNPDDPLCDCINALSRPEHTKLTKGNEIVYRKYVPACYFDRCKVGPSRVFTTTEMVEAQQGPRCSGALEYIDQRISVLGDNNIVDADQTVNKVNGEVVDPTKTNTNQQGGPTDESEILGIPQSKFFMFLLIFIAIIVGGYFFIFSDSDEPMQPMPYTPYEPMQQPQQQMQPM
jgi:hypothetical protein